MALMKNPYDYHGGNNCSVDGLNDLLIADNLMLLLYMAMMKSPGIILISNLYTPLLKMSCLPFRRLPLLVHPS